MFDLTCVWWRIARSTWRDSRRKKNSRHDTHTYTHTHTPRGYAPSTKARPLSPAHGSC